MSLRIQATVGAAFLVSRVFQPEYLQKKLIKATVKPKEVLESLWSELTGITGK